MLQPRENKMGTMPIGKLIITMSLPMIISMLVQALYNVIDSIFIAKYSSDALAAVTYAFPLQNLMIGFATGTGVGIKIKEVPVIFVNRVLGTSKMSGGIFSEAFFGVIKLKVGSWFRKYPKANK